MHIRNGVRVPKPAIKLTEEIFRLKGIGSECSMAFGMAASRPVRLFIEVGESNYGGYSYYPAVPNLIP